jgi:hypothetical protein
MCLLLTACAFMNAKSGWMLPATILARMSLHAGEARAGHEIAEQAARRCRHPPTCCS